MTEGPTLRWHVELTTEERDALLTQISIRRITEARALASGRLVNAKGYQAHTQLLNRAGEAISAGHMVWYKPGDDPDQWRRPRDGRRTEAADSERDAEPGDADSGS